MQAEILSVGTELLLGEVTDTNAQHISTRLRDTGVFVYRRVTLGDNPARITAAFKEALGRASLVIATGGLGPTADDVTAECLAAAMGVPLEFHDGAWDDILEWFNRRGRQPSPSDKKQAMILRGGVPLRNRNGTAPGQAILLDGKLAAVLPGPPREMIPMLEDELLPLVRRHFPDLVPLCIRNLKLVGLPESKVGEAVHDLMDNPNPSLAPYVGQGEIRLRIAARHEDRLEAQRLVSQVEAEVRKRLGSHIYGADSDTLESACGYALARRGLTLAVAESVTGGLVSHRITMVPGSSRYFKMGMVAYSSAIKASCLGVPGEATRRDDAVNADVAVSMARGVRELAGAKIGLATTGFAGPDGGTEREPVGTVYAAVAYEGGHQIDRVVYGGSRAAVKEYGAGRALFLLWTYLRSLSGAGTNSAERTGL